GLSADFGDFATFTADNASNHIRGKADVLGLDFLSILTNGWSTVHRSTGWSVVGWLLRKVGTVSGSGVGAASITSVSTVADAWAGALGSNSWVVKNGSLATLPVIDEAL